MRDCTRLHGFATASVFAVLSLGLGGASCDKKSVANPAPAPDPGPAVPFETPPGKTAPAGEPAAAKPAPAPATPTSGDKVTDLEAKLPSPCGKAESLKRTLEADPGCKRGPFAKHFVERLVKLDAPDDEIVELYNNRFGDHPEPKFELRDTPFLGTPNAPVVIVEFYDYACPHCREAAPVLEELVNQRGKDVVLYFKNFPLHKESMDGAKAAIAAFRQGKFHEMHVKLFANQGRQSREEIFGYAKEVGLDMKKFEADFNDPATTAKINADKQDGERANIKGTPTIYIDGRTYMDATTVDAMADWVDEDLAMNR